MATQSSKCRLTQAFIKGIKPNQDRDVFWWDIDPARFGVRVKPSGVKSYFVQYRNQRGQTRRLTLGRCDSMKVEDARKQARMTLAQVDKGHDPSAERHSLRDALTISQLCDRYLRDAKAGKTLNRGKPKKASTIAIDSGRIDRHIKPLLGHQTAEDLSRREAEAFMHKIIDGATATVVKTKPRGIARVTGGPGTASKAISLLSAIYNYGLRNGWVDNNPCLGIQKPADNKRRRFLTPEEYKRLGIALLKDRTRKQRVIVPNIIEVLALTGCRKSEILGLKAAEVDAQAHGLRFADTKTGSQLRPIGQTALAKLGELCPDEGDAWVYPSDRGDGHYVNLTKAMKAICQSAGLHNVSAHTLRHSFATVAHELGYSELTIAGLLGHSSNSVTARYAHHVDHALAHAADRISRTIAERMGMTQENPVIKLRSSV